MTESCTLRARCSYNPSSLYMMISQSCGWGSRNVKGKASEVKGSKGDVLVDETRLLISFIYLNSFWHAAQPGNANKPVVYPMGKAKEQCISLPSCRLHQSHRDLASKQRRVSVTGKREQRKERKKDSPPPVHNRNTK